MADETINIKVLLDTANSAKSIGDTRKAIKDLTSAALQVGEGSAEFQQLTSAAGELKDKLDDTRGAVKFFSDDMRNLNGAISIAKGIAAGFEVAQGAMALFGAESGNVQKALLKVQSAMALLNGIMAIQEVLQKTSKASLFVTNTLRAITVKITTQQARASAAEAAATGTATLAQRALNAAMAANPVGILITAIVALVSVMMIFSGESENTAAAQKEMADSIDKTNQVLADQLILQEQLNQLSTFSNADLENNIALLKAKGATEAEVYAAEKQLLQARLDELIANAANAGVLYKQESQDFLDYINAKKKLESDLVVLTAAYEKEKSDTKKTETVKQTKISKDFYDTLAKYLDDSGKRIKQNQQNITSSLLEGYTKSIYEIEKDLNNLSDSTTESYDNVTNKLIKLAEEGKKTSNELTNGMKSAEKQLYAEINSNYDLILAKINQLNTEIINNNAITNDKLSEDTLNNAFETAKYIKEYEIKIAKDKYDNTIALLKKSNLSETEIKQQTLKEEIKYNKDVEKINTDSNANLIKLNNNLYTAKQKRIDDEGVIVKTGLEEQKRLNEYLLGDLIKGENDTNKEIEKEKDKTYKAILQKKLEFIKAEETALLEANKSIDNSIKQNDAAVVDNINKLARERVAINDEIEADAKETQTNIGNGEKELTTLTKDEAKARKDAWTNYYQQLASEVVNLFAQIDANITAGNLSVIESRKAAALKAFDDEYQAYQDMTNHKTNAEQAKFDKDKEFADKKAAIEADFDKQKRDMEYEAAVRAWEYSMAQSVITTAGFILKSGEQVGLPGAAAAAILGAVQLAAIVSNPPQKYATGGLIKGEGTGTSDSIHTMLSNGESVINAKSTAMFLPMLDVINQAGGGAPLMNGGIKMATGGVVTNINNNQVDTARIEQILAAYLSQPIKTYVTSSDVTKGQRSDDRLKSRTSF